MSTFIREESGVHLAKKQGFHLFDLEPLIQGYASKRWRQLKVPEFVLWNEKQILIVEVKSTIPKSCQEAPDAHLERKISEKGYDLIPKLEAYCAELREKYTTALIILRPDIVGDFVNGIPSEGMQLIDSPDLLRKLRPNKVKQIYLLWILKDIPDDKLAETCDCFNKQILPKIKAWQTNCEIRVMNEQLAIEHGLAIQR